MNILAGKVFKFLWVAVWGKINIWQFLVQNKHYVIMTASNILLSLLFIYMAEQTTVRTEQYRKLSAELIELNRDYDELAFTNAELHENIETQRKAFGLSKAEVDTTEIIKEYDIWAEDLARMTQEITDNQTKRLGEIREQQQRTNHSQ